MHPSTPRVAVFEDDRELQTLLGLVLRAEGYEAVVEAGGYAARKVSEEFAPDLAIIDVHLDDGANGLHVAAILREANDDLPIIFLTGSASLDDRLAGFEAGGDDYITKPFSVVELLARMRALLRRAGRSHSSVLTFADVTVDEAAHRVERAGHYIDLTPTEFNLLRAFVRRPGVVVAKTALLAEVWGFDQYDGNVVEVHMSSLRRKLEHHGHRLVHTVRAVGYVLREPPVELVADRPGERTA
jgi:two-component system OmpR family response regulator